MKLMTSVVLIVFLIAGCDLVNTKSNGNLTPTFTLTDTTGQVRRVFRSGENFIMSFSVTNTTMATLRYYQTKSPIVFQILRNDSVVASSIDGYTFIAIALPPGFLLPGSILKNQWKAPTTPPQYPKVVLTSGSYEAKVLFPSFEQVKINTVPPIVFSISR